MQKPLPNRQSIRLKTYDYSKPGYYFITICTQNRQKRFGGIVDEYMQLNQSGKIVTEQWNDLPNRFPIVALDQFIVMPNHIHGIIQITVGAPLAVESGAPLAGAPDSNAAIRNDDNCDDLRGNVNNNRAPARGAPTIGDIIGAYKSLCVHHCLQWIKSNNPTFFMGTLWQRNYWEHIVRDKNELGRIRDYIRENPQKWETDKLNVGSGNIVMETEVEYGAELWRV